MLSLTEEQEMLVEEWERIARREFEEAAFTWEGDVPWENLELLADRGYMGINLPEAYGGGGLTEVDLALQIDAIGPTCPDTASALRQQSMNAPRVLSMFGSEAAKEHYLPRVTSGEGFIAIAISEPGAGSDVLDMNTAVDEAGDGELYLDGEKTWVSLFPASVAAVVWTKFPDGNVGAVVVDLDDPGVEVGEHYTNMAGRTQTHFFMEDVHVPEENVLVRGREAFKDMLRGLNWERCSVALGANALSVCAFEKALEYAGDREQFGQPIADFQGIRWKLADMAKRVEASRMLTYRPVMNARRTGRVPERLETSLASLYATETAERVISEALQIHGANGYQRGHPLEYLYRVQRGLRIGGGTNEIQKNGIADALIADGLPGR